MSEEHIAVIVGAARTPTGKFLGGLASFTAPQLGALVIKEAVRRSGIAPDAIDEVIMGNVVSAGVGQSPARQAAIHSGLPVDIPAFTVNKVCGSGLKAVMLAAQAIRAGDEQAFVAGGMESMSNAPYLLTKARTGYRMGNGEIVDAVVHDGLWCAFENIHMGNEAEIIAEKFGVTREEQDRFSLRSHQKAAEATAAGRFKDGYTDETDAGIPGGRHGYSRERAWFERWRLGHGSGGKRLRKGQWFNGAGAHHRLCRVGHYAALHLRGPHDCGEAAFGAYGLTDRGF